ncbi:hypothetical protein [Pseudorhizobium pelagicum]|uniref:Uncharacterized protein n=1 Tax=Pseudorhizobium pelagicum TaxID=1509405 RepID=A0A922P309_9HYPH|nr:hypothetical protein [Pseudorhizobium pelagicum]KEQ07504.1 hypothetical protein GV67_22380 [Pseudorhizobium pelagicum]KEQ09102.1 hypothetical protein GV68_25400 [Pseudorhizobium pelagicum]
MTGTPTKSRVEFVRLTSPDERSLLAFKCWLREACQTIQTRRLTYAPLSKQAAREVAAAAKRPADRSTSSIIRYMDVRNQRERQRYELRARAYLEAIAPAALDLPGASPLIDTIAELSATNESLRQIILTTFDATRPRSQKVRRDGDDWRPSRQTVTKTTMGTLVSLAERASAFADTAHHLSEGLPERDGKREHGIRSDHVEDAIYRFACDNFRFIPSAAMMGTLAVLGREEMIADQLWAKVLSASKPRPVTFTLIEQLFDEGVLLDWAADLEETTDLPSDAQVFAAYQVVLTMTIRRLKVEQKKLTGSGPPKKSRETRLVSRSAAVDASGPRKET